MKFLPPTLTAAILFVAFPLSAQQRVALSVSALRCDADRNPVGVDVPQPTLGWQLASDARGDLQTAYQVLVASSREQLAKDQADLWNSGSVQSEESVNVRYQGKPLASAQQAFWKVRVWDQAGQPSAWSEPAAWAMGVLQEAAWQGARWIAAPTAEHGATLRLRRAFEVKGQLRRAVVFVCGLGQYEMTLDGAKVGDDVLTPGWTNYKQTCLYDGYDVTRQLQSGGAHAIGLLLGNGMYNVEPTTRYKKFTGSFGPQKAIAQLRLEYGDGSVQIIDTDETWRVGPGPITYSHVFGGEDYDARLEEHGWDNSGFDDSRWPMAVVVKGPGGQLRGHSFAAPPIRGLETLPVASNKVLRPGVAVYDLGQNATVMPRLKVRGPAGSSVKITPAELLHPDGTIDRRSGGGGEAYWKYTLAGSGSTETYFPKFYDHGCRYLQVELNSANGEGEVPVIESLEGVVVHSSAESVGGFSCSNELFNRIRTLVRWAQLSNAASIMTDCPHRERLGWLEQIHLNGPALRSEFRLDRLFTKTTGDMIEAQQPSGLVPDIAPEYVVFKEGFRDSPEWGSAIALVPWQQYEWTGNPETLERAYGAMARYLAYLTSRAENHIVSHGLGDWYDIGPKPAGRAQLTPVALTATAFYFQDAHILAQTAQRLGKTEDAAQYAKLAEEIRVAFNEKFFNAGTCQYATGSQTSNALALALGLAEPPHRQAVLENLVKDVQAHGNAVTAGDVGYRYLLRALADGGRSDVIFDMNNQSEKPGYGMMLKRGATALTEAWNQIGDGSSQNHFMLGQITEWFYRDLVGIAPDVAGPGFRHVIILPQPVGDVTWAEGSYDSLLGKIAVAWKKDSAKFQLTIVLPPGSTATVFIPAKGADSVLEGDTPVSTAQGVKLLRTEPGAAVCEVASGRYVFSSTL